MNVISGADQNRVVPRTTDFRQLAAHHGLNATPSPAGVAPPKIVSLGGDPRVPRENDPDDRQILTLPHAANTASDVLAKIRADRFVVQDFRSLSDSIEWDLGRLFYQERGSHAFRTTEHVPFEINNDGTLSAHAAEVFFANLVASESSQALGTTIFVLEIGPGTGLFAKFFLDAFREMCVRHAKDFYERLCFVLADYSDSMLADIDKARILGPHRDRCRLVRADARDMARTFSAGGSASRLEMGPFDAIFLNYMLDSLPAAVLEFDDPVIKELRVRTCLARNFNARNGLGLTPEAIAQKASSDDPTVRRTLIDLYPYFTLDYDFLPVDPAGMPYADFAIGFGRRNGRHLLHSFGAIQCLQGCWAVLSGEGFILMNDYGQGAADETAEATLHQKFSGSTHIGLNFPLLAAFFQNAGDCRWIEPDKDPGGIFARLLGRSPSEAAIDTFRRCFDKTTYDRLNEPVARARQHQQCGQYEAALGAYQEALARQPRNWLLMGEVAKYLIFAARDYRAALQLAATAISLNSDRSADLWDTVGDAYLGLEMGDKALGSFQRALAIDETDVRGRLGLAHVFGQRGEYMEAMRLIAEAITLDKACQYREMLLRKQADIVLEIDHQNREEMRVMLTRNNRLGIMKDAG
ncbi:MAG TPA: SAM-dependent methyltransferase [Pirellulales bacterium]|nr:SAM-dependent methyltransferase [Pirellulales bacterium]